jgi:hypothetical protein
MGLLVQIPIKQSHLASIFHNTLESEGYCKNENANSYCLWKKWRSYLSNVIKGDNLMETEKLRQKCVETFNQIVHCAKEERRTKREDDEMSKFKIYLAEAKSLVLAYEAVGEK